MDISISKDLVYGEHGRALRWDIYRPATAAANAPVVIAIHGGGYRSGDRSDVADVCREYARRGYVAIAPEYRYLTETRWPGPLDDIKLAVETLRSRGGDLGLAPEHIYLTGFSCGGQLALLAASAFQGLVDGVAAFYLPAVFTKAHANFLGIDDEAVVVAADPVTHAARLPPTIIFGGEEDILTPPAMLLAVYKAINEAGGTADIRLFSHMVHAFVGLPGMIEQTVGDAHRFFERNVTDKARFDAANAEHHRWFEELTRGARSAPASDA